ncbi:MAG: DUF4340 domain-containing protein [Myxococcota bacterium]
MQPRSAAILLAVALALGAFVYFYEIRGGETREAAEARARQLFPEMSAADVEAVWFETTDGQPARIERREGGWRIVEPIESPADPTVVDGLVGGLAELISEGAIDDPQAPEVYGLGAGASRVGFRRADGEGELWLGRQTPVGGMTYVASAPAADVVYTVLTHHVTPFRKALPDLRERRVLPIEPSTIRRIEASWPLGDAVVLERSEDDAWRVVEPLEAQADQETVDGLLSDLQFLRASDFYDDPSPEAVRALDPPQFHARLFAEADEGVGDEEAEGAELPAPVFEITLGSVHGDGRVVRSSLSEILLAVPAERLEDLPRRVVDYRYKDLAEFSILDAQQVELAFADETESAQEAVVIVAERGEQGWETQPERMQPGKIARLVSELSRLEAQDIIAEKLGDEERAALGLSPPRLVVRVHGEAEDGERPLLAELFLGDADPERGIYAQVPGDDLVYSLDFELAEHLPVSLEAFRNRFMSEESAPAEGP